MEHSSVLFHIGPLEVSSVMITMVAISLFLVIISILVSRHISTVPGRLQNALEMIIEAVEKLLSSIMGKDLAKKHLPLLATLFIFILLSNYSGLLPLSGELPGLSAPTSSLSVTAGLAIVVFLSTHYYGIKEHKLSYFKHFFTPVAFMFPLLIIEEFVRPLSLSLRLYGNIIGEETVTKQFFEMVPLIVPLVPQALSILMGLIQAFVFMILASVYISGAAGEGH